MATAKKTAAKKSTAAKKEPEVEEKDSKTPDLLSIEEIAAEVIEGKWQTGRERTIMLTNAGYDSIAVQHEIAKQLSER